MSENKFKVKEVLKDVFPELVRDLEQYGQRVPVFLTKDGVIKDGIKRTLLAENPSELKVEIVDDASFVENVPLTKKQRNIVIKFAYDNLVNVGKCIHKEAVEKLSKRYGLSTRQIENIIYGHEIISSPSNKPRKNKCDNCLKVQSLTEENNRLREQYQKVVGYPEEVVASDEFRLVKAISLFMEKHPNKEFTPDGKIMEKLT
jgi:hypothetical protein